MSFHFTSEPSQNVSEQSSMRQSSGSRDGRDLPQQAHATRTHVIRAELRVLLLYDLWRVSNLFTNTRVRRA